jgi:hypothetical protein
MTRAEFLKAWTEDVAAGRARNFPDMTPAEHAASYVGDLAHAAKLWNKKSVRDALKTVTVQQWRAQGHKVNP